jgi:hypothetical protein
MTGDNNSQFIVIQHILGTEKESKLNAFTASNGITLFTFGMVSLTLSVDTWITILFFCASMLVGLLVLFPELMKNISPLYTLLSLLVFLAWFLGFVAGFLQVHDKFEEPWKSVIYYFGYSWVLIILLAVQRFAYEVSLDKRTIFKLIVRTSIPLVLLALSTYNFTQQVPPSDIVLLAMAFLTALVSLGIWEVESKLPGISS